MAAARQPVALLNPVTEMREAVLGSDQLSQVRPAVGTDMYSSSTGRPRLGGFEANDGFATASCAALSEWN